MRVLFASTQGAGHFNPLLPFIDACVRGGHEVMVAGPPPLAETVARAGCRFWPGAGPREADAAAVWARVRTASPDEAKAIVVGDVFAGLNLRAMLPHLCAACGDWRPDVLIREQAEYASAIAADRHGVPQVRLGVSLAAVEDQVLAIAAPRLDGVRPGVAERVRHSPYLTLFPASLEDPQRGQPRVARRFRDPAAGPSSRPLPEWWAGDDRPLVYITFGSVSGSQPTAGTLFGSALAAAAEMPARVLLTVGHALDIEALGPAPANVRIERWVPQADVFGHARAVVCHGGSGTTLGALAAGLPLVVVPLFADQPDNARRVAAVGAGIAVQRAGAARPGPTSREIDAAALCAAVQAVLDDPAYERAAGRLASEMAALPPTDAAFSGALIA